MKKEFVIGLVVVFVIILLFAGGLAIYYSQGPCGTTKVDDAFAELVPLLDEYNDTDRIASTTARINLSGPVSQLQSILRDIKKIEVPGCMDKGYNLIVDGFETNIDAYIAFMGGDENELLATTYYNNAVDLVGRGMKELDRIRECAPICE